MIRTRWYKVIIDLWQNRMRTLVVALAIAVGVYAVGVIINTRVLLVREFDQDQAAAAIASAIMRTHPFDDAVAQRLADIPGVAAAEGRLHLRVYTLNEQGERRNVALVGIPNFRHMGVDKITPLQGQVIPGRREVILERLAVDYLGTNIGDTLIIVLPDGSEKSLRVVGVAHDPQQINPDILREGYGYVTPETMGSLGYSELYTELRLRVTEKSGGEAHIQQIVRTVEDQLERSGREVISTQIITESLVKPFIDTVVLILSSFGLVILLLSGFLVVNAISALIKQQVQQIGVMKLIGARRHQIMSLYITTVMVYGVIALLLGYPLSVATARLLMTDLVEGLLNVLPDSYALPLAVVVLQLVVGLSLPLLAGLLPVLQGAGLTTYKALNETGMGSAAYGVGWLERLLVWLQRFQGVQRPFLLAIRNTMRHKGRLVQTLVVLIIGTALFISVLTVRVSVAATLADFLRFHQYDVSVRFEQPYRQVQLERLTKAMPNIVAVESWTFAGATRQRANGSESDPLRLFAVPAETTFMQPRLHAGRWLDTAVPNGIVINSDVVEDEPDLHPGASLTLNIGDRASTWTVIGVVPTDSNGPAIYMSLTEYAYATRTVGEATQIQVRAEQHSAASQQALATQLIAVFEAAGFAVSGTRTAEDINDANQLLFTIVVAFLVLMALLLAAVGGLGLTTTMSINILERIREIGVLRAIGASTPSIRQIVLAEGVVIGLLSWAMGTLLSWPVSAFMSEQIGLALLNVPLTYQYSTVAMVIWFFMIQMIAVAASLGPARDAVRLTIREVLAYE